jgi:uncharacterized membrane-anchored protein YjiN (DUF445 family)
MPQANSEVEKFFEELPTNDQKIDKLFDAPKSETPEKEVADEETPNNRRERRLRQKLESERESAMALNERVRELTEKVSKYENVINSESDERLTQIFGDDTPEKKALAKLFSDILQDNAKQAEQKAIDAIESRSQLEEAQVEIESRNIDEELDYLEETYGVDLTSDSSSAKKLRNNLIEAIETLSPKDRDGNIIEYADFDSTFQMIQSIRPEPSRNKELSNRTMQPSKTTDSSKDANNALEKYLNEQGIRTRIR